MSTIEEILQANEFFQGLPADQIRFLANCATTEHFDEGVYLFREGEKADVFYLILQGRVSLDTFVPGRGHKGIQTVGAGEILGWSWLYPPYLWHFDGRVLRPTETITFDAPCVREKCDQDHVFGHELLKRFTNIIVQRLQATRLQMLDVYAVK